MPYLRNDFRKRRSPVRFAANLSAAEVAPARRCAHICQNQLQEIMVHPTIDYDFDGWNANAFLKNFSGQRHRAWGHPTYIGMMRTIGGKESRSADTFHKNRGDKGDVRQMRAAAVRIIDQDAIPWLHVNVLDGVQDGHRHGAEVHGNVLGLGDHVSLAVKQSA